MLKDRQIKLRLMGELAVVPAKGLATHHIVQPDLVIIAVWDRDVFFTSRMGL